MAMTHRVGDAIVRAFGDQVTARLGLRFGGSRQADLHRAVETLARGHPGGAHGAISDWMSRAWSADDIRTLAGLLCVGETYFFREPAAFDLLEHELLAPHIVWGRHNTRRLRVWSAGCATGEEAYSLSIMLHRLLPDIDDWDVTALGTDLHAGFLERAREGVYGDWSFRGVPDLVREQYFDRLDGEHWRVKDRYRRIVHFEQGNLIEPMVATEAFDLILCRNVLMYFSREHIHRVLRQLHLALADDGLLLVAGPEAAGRGADGFETMRFEHALFYRKAAVGKPAAVSPLRAPHVTPTHPLPAHAPQPSHHIHARHEPDAHVLQAIARCEAAIAHDKCDAALHVQHAALLEEAREPRLARDALRRALFLEPGLVVARSAIERLSKLLATRAARHPEIAS
jgi:chemotaxis protein methyltransferase CheR